MLLRLLIFTFFLSAIKVFSQTPTIETGIPNTLAKWRAANYSDVRYKLNLTLGKMSPTLKGTIEILLKNNADQIVLDWRKTRAKEDLSKVENIFVNGKSAKYEEINEHLVFKEGVRVGENIIKLDFTSPILTSGGAITRYVDKEDNAEYIYSLFVPSDASTAFPVFDQPDLKARFQLNVIVPEKWKVISNTEIVKTGITTLDERPFPPGIKESRLGELNIFLETQPISTYVFAFVAGDFAEIDCRGETCSRPPLSKDKVSGQGQAPPLPNSTNVETKIYVRKSQAEKFKQHATEVFQLNREGVKFLEGWFDYKFPFPKYDLVLIPEFPFGGMEHAGATFLREDRIIFPTQPTKNDYVTRANVIFHEAAHQWFGDTVTMRWFDDLWLKEGFAEFMAYKTLEKVMPEYNAWKIFYERNKQGAYLTDLTKGTTPIYQEIPNLSAAKSAYGNIVYRKAPSFLRQAEFYLGADKFQTAVRAFLKKHEFANAEWTDLVKEFETASGQELKVWANIWVKKRGVPIIRIEQNKTPRNSSISYFDLKQSDALNENGVWQMRLKILDRHWGKDYIFDNLTKTKVQKDVFYFRNFIPPQTFVFPNYQDYGYGIFLLDKKSRDYVFGNIQNEKDDFLRTMMWGSLWDSVREAESSPKDYVELIIKNINVESDESTIQTLLNRVSIVMNYYLSEAQGKELTPKIEAVLIGKMQNAPTLGQRITFYRAFLNIASSENARTVLKDILSGKFVIEGLNCRGDSCGRPMSEAKNVSAARLIGQAQDLPLQNSSTLLKTKDKFDIATKLLISGDKDATSLLAELEKTETTDEAKRYAYAAKAGFGTTENKARFWNSFVNDETISESWIESAFVPFNSVRHSELTLPYLERALVELPNLKRNRKIFFVNGWLAAFIGGQRNEQALTAVNKFLADNPHLDKDLRLKILETVDGLERAVKIRKKFAD